MLRKSKKCLLILDSPSSVNIFSVLEPCGHEVQYAGMCANCGKDLTQGDYLGNADAGRATVAMSHDTLGLTVSYSEAARLERETTKRLVQTSKLSLIDYGGSHRWRMAQGCRESKL
jgi:RNA polymerase II subunit A-like phosphatase